MNRKVEIKEYTDPNDANTYKALYVDGIVFDWYIEEKELELASKFANDDLRRKSIVGDVVGFFLECFGEFIGREICLKEVNEAIEKGYIECSS